MYKKMNTPKILNKYRIHPLKKFGQNFLIDRTIIKKIIEAANLHLNDIVLEIGPGTGNITKELSKKAKQVFAIEKDKRIIKLLKENIKNFNNIKIIRGDILRELKYISKDISKTKSKYKVIGNLPFYLTAITIRKLLESNNKPEEIILIIQKEVAQRICQEPPRMNILAVSVQFYSKPKIIYYVPKESFWPIPKVDAAIIKLIQKKEKQDVNKDLFFKIVKAGFAHPRKQLINNLSNNLKIKREEVNKQLLKNNIQPTSRAETLNLKDWVNLSNDLRKIIPTRLNNI